MQPIQNWNEVKPIMGGSNKLPAGGYVCLIRAIKEEKSSTNKNMLTINYDIAEGDYKDYFMEKYKNSKPKDDTQPIKWPGKHYIVLEGENWEGRFKGFITSLEESNTAFKWENCNWDTSKLVGLQFGGIFREEEFEGFNGTGKNTKLYLIRSVDVIRNNEFEIPEPKLLQKNDDGPFGNTVTTFSEDTSDLPF